MIDKLIVFCYTVRKQGAHIFDNPYNDRKGETVLKNKLITLTVSEDKESKNSVLELTAE